MAGNRIARGWIGVDLDGTLAKYDGWKGVAHIGEPVPLILQRVKDALAKGREVRIFTARVSHVHGDPLSPTMARMHIEKWCLKHIGRVLPVTNVKDFGMVELWDDRAVQVEENTGVFIGKSRVA